jgi:hypothetical protein
MILVIGISESIEVSRLQPIAVDPAFECESVRTWRHEAIEIWKFRRRAGPHIGKQNAVTLDHRISLLPDVAAHRAAFRLRRRFQTFAFGVEQPAVKGAAQAAILKPSIGKIGAAMRATAA